MILGASGGTYYTSVVIADRKWEWKWEGQTLSKGFELILSKQLYNNDEMVTGTERTIWDRSRIREDCIVMKPDIVAFKGETMTAYFLHIKCNITSSMTYAVHTLEWEHWNGNTGNSPPPSICDKSEDRGHSLRWSCTEGREEREGGIR